MGSNANGNRIILDVEQFFICTDVINVIYTGCGKKSKPLIFLLFSEQPFGILI